MKRRKKRRSSTHPRWNTSAMEANIIYLLSCVSSTTNSANPTPSSPIAILSTFGLSSVSSYVLPPPRPSPFPSSSYFLLQFLFIVRLRLVISCFDLSLLSFILFSVFLVWDFILVNFARAVIGRRFIKGDVLGLSCVKWVIIAIHSEATLRCLLSSNLIEAEALVCTPTFLSSSGWVVYWYIYGWFACISNFQFKILCEKVGNKAGTGLYIGFSFLFISTPIYANETKNIQKLPQHFQIWPFGRKFHVDVKWGHSFPN